MDPQKNYIPEIVKKLDKTLPHFADGRIDYSKSKIAPVVSCFIIFNNKILLVKRSNKINMYPDKWNAVTGYLDEVKPIVEKAFTELKEEIGLNEKEIKEIKLFNVFEFIDKNVDKIWVVHPVLVNLKNMIPVKLNWEHSVFKWIDPKDLNKFPTVPNLLKTYQQITSGLTLFYSRP